MSVLPLFNTVEIGEVRNVAVDFRGKLDSGELLTGTPTITEVGSADLTLNNKFVSTTTKTIRGATVLAGQAVLFTATGFLLGREYVIKISVATTATPAQTLIEFITLRTDDE